MPQSERIENLNHLARSQMMALLSNNSMKGLKLLDERTSQSEKPVDKE
jgi:hypothetical protein